MQTMNHTKLIIRATLSASKAYPHFISKLNSTQGNASTKMFVIKNHEHLSEAIAVIDSDTNLN